MSVQEDALKPPIKALGTHPVNFSMNFPLSGKSVPSFCVGDWGVRVWQWPGCDMHLLFWEHLETIYLLGFSIKRAIFVAFTAAVPLGLCRQPAFNGQQHGGVG